MIAFVIIVTIVARQLAMKKNQFFNNNFMFIALILCKIIYTKLLETLASDPNYD